MKNYLVIRLSSMGDVALTIPVLQAVVSQNERIHLTIITRPAFAPLLATVPNLSLVLPDLKDKHKGLLGIYRLFLELKKRERYDIIIDLHDVLRSKVLRYFFNRIDQPFFKINKGRRAKKRATQKNHSPIQRLSHTTERYAEVFRQAGLKVDLTTFEPVQLDISDAVQSFLKEKKSSIVGIAPFAKHEQKQFPFEKIKKVVQELVAKNVQVIIFGGGKAEKNLAQELEVINKNQVHSVIGMFTMTEELMLLQEMDLVLAMDSSNMHLARLVGTKVISIWGATHPYIGFSPFQQDNEELMIQIPVEELPCRPCSVYGNKPCHRGDMACMNRIKADMVSKKILSNLVNI